MWFVLGFIAVIILILLFEYRIRRPDEIVIFEKVGIIRKRKGRFYPRHFSLAVSGTIHSTSLKIEAEAKGKIPIHVDMATAVAASANHLHNLIKVGGWHKNMVAHASKEFENILQISVREFTEKHEIEELSSDSLSSHLNKKMGNTIELLGLDVMSLNVHAIYPVDEKIADAIQQLETARIIEETEKANQKARVAATKAKLSADEQIAAGEHDLELKKYKLKKIALDEESKIANLRVKEELERRKLQLEFDRKEIDLIRNNPELLILTPQAARLAEASQNLRNARTVVNLSGNESIQGTQLLNMFQLFLQNLVNSTSKDAGKKKKTDQ
jgi:hypothetical protein